LKKFIVIYHAPKDAMEQAASATPEEMKAGMEPWFGWKKMVEEKGGKVDIGNPLGNGTAVTKNGTSPSQKEVVGYSIVEANSMDEAVEYLKSHPHLQWVDGCSIEVHESLPLPGME